MVDSRHSSSNTTESSNFLLVMNRLFNEWCQQFHRYQQNTSTLKQWNTKTTTTYICIALTIQVLTSDSHKNVTELNR